MTTKIILESPFANENKQKFNDNYFYLCVSARKMMTEDGDAPLFFHALYTQFLHDNVQEERNLGLVKSFVYHSDADNKTYAIDRGISGGMILGAEDALKKGMDIKFYTVLPETDPIAKKIDTINNITNVEKRWKMGKRMVDQMMNTPKHKDSFEKTGDLTLYSHSIKSELKDVKKCIMEFFAPLVDSIRAENKVENKVENKKEKKKRSYVGVKGSSN